MEHVSGRNTALGTICTVLQFSIQFVRLQACQLTMLDALEVHLLIWSIKSRLNSAHRFAVWLEAGWTWTMASFSEVYMHDIAVSRATPHP